ncbi:MAG: TonB-dependent receptor, partial [Alphaproteobacteria bacterium]|nr:TonB-dependent receptor [Alphaproteobacteria bacterium]
YFVEPTGTKFRASYGTAFRAPSLFELFDPTFGNAALTPETSKGWDAGIDQTFAGGRASFSATYFSLDIENLIQFVFPAGFSTVQGTTERHGFELSGRAQMTDWLAGSVSYTRTDTEDADGNRLIRVPRHVYTIGLDIKPSDRLTINTTASIVRDTLDVSSAFTPDFQLDDYVLVNAKATYAVSDSLSLYVRGENLLNEEYQTLRGFGTSDLAVYAGLNMKLNGRPPLDPPVN